MPTAEIRSKAADLTKGLTTQQEKLQAIYSYVAQQFRYIGISFGIGRYRPHGANHVLSDGYGDCKDKATLLASLLEAAGITSWPVLINSQRRIDPDVPSIGQFNHVISVVPQNGKLLWIDTTTELAPLGLLYFSLRGKQALVIPTTQPAYLDSTPVQPSVPNRANFQAKGKLANDGTYTGRVRYTLEGDDALTMRLIFNNVAQSDWQKTMQEISENLGFGGTVSNVSVSPPGDTAHPFTVSYDYVRKNYSDWDHQRQIVPPLPMLIPGAPPDSDKGKPQPFILGDPEVSNVQASMELPKGYAPVLPKGLDLTTLFGKYHSTYSFKNGVFTTQRRTDTTVAEVPVSGLEKYRKFQKAISDDVDHFIVLTAGTSATAAPAGEPPSPEVQAELRAAYQASMQEDARGALDHVNSALKMAPKLELAWLMAASLHMELQEPDDAIAAARQAISSAPDDIRPCQLLSRIFLVTGRKDQMIPVWRSFVQRNPQNARGHASLGNTLLLQKKYSEAIPELQAAARLDPQNWRYERALGEGLQAAKEMPQAVSAYEKAAALHPGPDEWNDLAYALAETNTGLPKAEDLATRSVKALEAKSESISLDDLTDPDLQQVLSLASAWDTLAWVYFHEDKLAMARQYEKASFALVQYAVVGDHLGRIEEKLGHRSTAVRDYAMAYVLASSQQPFTLAIFTSNTPDISKRLLKLAGTVTSFNNAIIRARDELSNLRTYRVSKVGLKPGTANLFVLFSAGQRPQVKFVSGSGAFRIAAPRLAGVAYRQPFPDAGPAKILRRGVLTCSEGIATCDFVLLPPETVHSVE